MGHIIITSTIGLFLIALGFLIVRYPVLIAGYNTMPKKERDKIDIRPTALLMKKVMIGMGLAMIAGAFLFHYLGNREWESVYMLAVILGGVAIMLIKGQRMAKDLNLSKRRKRMLWLTLIIVCIILVCIADTARPATFEVKEDMFIVHGGYGLKIPVDSIIHVEITDRLPEITLRSNGVSLWKYHKGNYQTKEYGRVMLYLHSGHGPYLLVRSKVKPPVFIDRDSREELESLYSLLKK